LLSFASKYSAVVRATRELDTASVASVSSATFNFRAGVAKKLSVDNTILKPFLYKANNSIVTVSSAIQ